MNGRGAQNMALGLIAEAACRVWLGLPPPPDISAKDDGWRDGGVDIDCGPGYRIDVKASRPAHPELMIPMAHEAKFRRATCPVDIFVKATVDGHDVTLTCWQWRTVFLQTAHRDNGERYPFPTLWQLPQEAHQIARTFIVEPRRAAEIWRFVQQEFPDLPWRGWLTY